MIESQIAQFERLESELDAYFASAASDTTGELLKRMDEEISACFDLIVGSEVSQSTELFRRLRFLISKLSTFDSNGALAGQVLQRIEQDLSQIEAGFIGRSGKLTASNQNTRTRNDELIELCIVSQANNEYTHAELFTLSARITPHNAEHDVTGVLIYDDATRQFFQVMECYKSHESTLMERIQSCPFHGHIKVHSRSYIKQRSYPDWTLSLLTTEDLKKICPKVEVLPSWFEQQLSVSDDAKTNEGHRWLVSSLGQLVA